MVKTVSTKKVVTNSIIYIASGLLLKCFSFFLLPLYTAYLTPEDYGINSLATSFIDTAGFIAAFSLFSAVMRFYVDLKDDSIRLKRFYGSISIFAFLSSICFGVILTVFQTYVSKVVFAGIPYYPIIFVCLLALVFHCQQSIFDTILRSQQQARKSSILSISFFFVNCFFTILFICYFKLGALGVIAAAGISYFAYTIFFVVYMLRTKQITFCMDFVLLKDALRYSLPIMPHNLSTHIAMFISKILIGDVVSLGSLGLYSVANKFGHLADTIQVYVNRAYGPWFYEGMHSGSADFKIKLRKTVQLLVSCIGLCFLVLALFSHDCIVLFVNKNYIEAWRYVPFIILVFTIKTMYYFYVTILFYYKAASKYLFTATLTGSILNVLFSFYMIPLWGVMGSILAMGFSMIIRISIVVAISKRFAEVGLNAGDFIKNFLTVAAFIFTGLSLSYMKYGDCFNVLNFIFKVFVVSVYCCYVFFRYKEQLISCVRILRKKYNLANR
jgi:O-antigen/teichoic acid export membrane protein